MRKLLKSILSVFAFLTFASGTSQTVITDDYAEIPYTNHLELVFPNVWANDSVDGMTATLSNMTPQVIPTDDPSIGVESNGESYLNPITVPGGTISGVHICFYGIQSRANPNSRDIGCVTINVAGCLLPQPSISGLISPDCSSFSGSLTLDNLPEGAWHLVTWRNGVKIEDLAGTGLSHTVTGLTNAVYYFSVYNDAGCQSIPLKARIVNNCFMSLVANGTYNDYNQDGVVNPGDAINYTFTYTNNYNVPLNGIQLNPHVFPNSPLVIAGDIITSLAPGQSDSTTFSGFRVLSQSDINAGYVSDLVDGLATDNSSSPPMPYYLDAYAGAFLNLNDGLKLIAFLDSDSNGIQDLGEPTFGRGHFQYQSNDGTTHNVSTPGGPYYLYESDPSNTYAVDFIADDGIYYSVNNSYSGVSVANDSGIATLKFAVSVVPHHDLAVHLSRYIAPRPGFEYKNYVYYSNNGTFPETGTLTFTKDGAITITNISTVGTVANADGFTLDFSILPNETRSFTVTYQVPSIPAVNIGQQLTNAVSITIPDGDTDIGDNLSTNTETISGSYDPNDKAESHGGKIAFDQFSSSDYLTYTIRFENTGNAEAVNITVNDLLDDKLDEASVRMIASSHDYILDRRENNVTWEFPAIRLAPSVDGSDIGKGYVTFEVKPKPGYASGDIIPNAADIYFDFNPAIITETCTTEFVATLATDSFGKDRVMLYPNPSSSVVNIKSDMPIKTISITDISGKPVLSATPDSITAILNVSALSSGIYFVKITSEGKQQVFKLIRQ